jgi:predicted permease
MHAIFNVTAPFFAIVLVGYLLTKFELFPQSGLPAFNAFILYCALPCMLFGFGSRTPFEQIVNLKLLLAWMVTSLILLGLVLLSEMVMLSHLPKREALHHAAFGAMAASFGNTGYMGLPLLVALLGARVAPIAIIANLVDVMIVISLVLAMAEAASARGGWRDILKNCALGIVKNPLLWSVLVGAAFSGFGWHLPSTLDNTAKLLAAAAPPCALFAIGASLVQNKIVQNKIVQNKAAQDTKHALTALETHFLKQWDVWVLVMAKLLWHPFIALLIGLAFGLDKFTLSVMLLVAALPTAGNVYIFTQRYGGNGQRVSQVVLLTTALAFLTFSGLVWVLGLKTL